MPNESPIKLTAEQEAEVKTMTSVEQITQYMRDAAVAQNLVRPYDAAHPDLLVDVPQKARITKTIELDGTTYEFSGEDDAAVTRLQLEFMRGRNPQATQPTTPEKPRGADGKFVAADAPTRTPEQAANLANLELKFKRGEISASDYLMQSGALEEYVEKVQSRAETEIVQSWAQATEAFKSGPGADWPGGERNKEILGFKLAELGLTDATDKVAALTQAFNAMRLDDAIAKATSKTEVDEALAKFGRAAGVQTNAGSSVWGSR
jgi:hypothetical protein